jgi:hypothetical protein
MSHDTRPEFVQPRGKSPQRVIQRPRIPDPTWSRALAKAHRIERPIGHVLTELLEEWLDRSDPTDPTGPDSGPTIDRTEVDQ